MKFKSFTKKYDFSDSSLVKTFPEYIVDPLRKWLVEVLKVVGIFRYAQRYGWSINSGFIENLNLTLREKFPTEFSPFLGFVFADPDRTANFIALCLQNYADSEEANSLEGILSRGGSAFTVIKTEELALDHVRGVYDLAERVSPIIQENAQDALSQSEELQKAWQYCYSRNPNYNQVVIHCQNVLEKILKDSYEPENGRPQLGIIIKNLKRNPEKLKFMGDTVLTEKETILDLIENTPSFRGMHTSGTGKNASKEEAEYILHTVIYFWTLHRK